jgi:TolA-binding protein
MSETDLQQTGLNRLAALAGARAHAPVLPNVNDFGKRRLLAALSEQRAEPGGGSLRSHARPIGYALASLLTAAAVAAAWFWLGSERPLRYEIHGGQRLASNYVAASRREPANVVFSDGSTITAAPGSRLRIDTTAVHGARVLIEHGSVTAQVTHSGHSKWVFGAGPFDIRITGTRFTAVWDPEEQALDLTLHEGSVEVDSPLGSSHCVVRSGQRFHASLSTGSMRLENVESGGPLANLDLPAPLTAATQPVLDQAGASEAQRHASHRAGKPSARSDAPGSGLLEPSGFGAAVQRGEFQRVVSAALERGLPATLASADADALRALGDAARYTGEFEVAEQSLRALRERFANSAKSTAAAFLLGRTFELASKPSNADRAYRTYLKEAPAGPFAADALAGHMRMVEQLQGPAAAKPIAQDYLRRYRDGVHAKAARRLANEP